MRERTYTWQAIVIERDEFDLALRWTVCLPVLAFVASIDGSEERLGLLTDSTADARELPLLPLTLMRGCLAKILDIDPIAIGQADWHADATTSHMAQGP